MPDDAIDPLSSFVAGLRVEAISPDAIGAAKTFVLDSLGVALAGSSAPGVAAIREQWCEWGGAPEATVLVFGNRLPAPAAALLNGTMIQARDFDDTHHEAIVHVNAGVLPAALAVAERLGGVSGARFLTALIAGIDVACRIGAAITTPVAFTRTGTLAFFGAAAATASLLGLDARTTRDAFGIAYAQTATNMQAVHDGALVKRMHPGFGARAGIMAALLAARGLTGARRVLEGPYGYLHLYERGAYRRERILDGLGSAFEVTRLSVKPYPCSLDTHAAIMAALALRAETGLTAEAIDRVTVDLPFLAFDAAGKPFDAIQGHRVVESILSVPYAVAVAPGRGRVTLDDFTEAAVADATIGALARRVEARVDPRLPPKAFVPVTVRIQLRDGQVLERRVDRLLGTPELPMSQAQLLEKFWHCTGYAARPVPRERLDRLLPLIDGLEGLPDVAAVLDCLVSGEDKG
jgi:2-methylcitrate dehydratase PrpD